MLTFIFWADVTNSMATLLQTTAIKRHCPIAVESAKIFRIGSHQEDTELAFMSAVSFSGPPEDDKRN